MNAIVIEHVKVQELPVAWRSRLASAPDATVTVRIEEETGRHAPPVPETADDPLFGMWADREDLADVAAYIRSIRAGRLNTNDPRIGRGDPTRAGRTKPA
ncbi:MAG: hypothetical protein ACK5TK_18495 [Betaproteobacteria bacterium]